MPPRINTISYRIAPEVYDILGQSPLIGAVRRQIELYATTSMPIIISGATGTGKELVARALHIQSERTGRFLAVNCAGIVPSLQESELFGYAPGTFTGQNHGGKRGFFEATSGGTLFLDEFGYTSPEIRSKLLRAVEQGEIVRVGDTFPTSINTRLVISSTKSLDEMLAESQIQSDIYFRLDGADIPLPTLAERIGDIPLIADHYCQKYSEGKITLSRDALNYLQSYLWPGNVRELIRTIENLVTHKLHDMKASGIDTGSIDEDYVKSHHKPRTLPEHSAGAPHSITQPANDNGNRTFYDSTAYSFLSFMQSTSTPAPEALEKLELALYKLALLSANGNQAAAARMTGINERSIWHIVKKMKGCIPEFETILPRYHGGSRSYNGTGTAQRREVYEKPPEQ